MNLIKQLGGYDIASVLLESCEDMDLIGGFKPKEIQQALLEHRRANNIYEAEDKVIEITNYSDVYVLTVKSISNVLMVCENDNLNASYGLLNHNPSFYVRHATDKEIKQGYRDE